MRIVQGMGVLVLIALGVPAPKMPKALERQIRGSDALAAKVWEIEDSGERLNDLPVLPLANLVAGEERIRCDEVGDGVFRTAVCLGDDAVYVTARDMK